MSNQDYQLPTSGATNKPSKTNKALAVFIVIVVTALLLFIMRAFKPEEQEKDDAKIIPAVEIINVEAIDYTVPIISEGMVLPKTKINISSEVTGKITYVAGSFSNGGSFTKGDVLVKIDPIDYQLAITRAKANVASRQASLDLERAKSDLAKKDWKKYGKKGKPDALNLNLPQVASAKAALSGAQADLQLAKRNLDKTTIIAPFSGAILTKNTDLGQFVTIGTALASVASTEVAEIRVSLSDEQLQLSGLADFDGSNPISVKITSEELTGIQWQGYVVSIEAQRDVKTLFNNAIIDVQDPFNQQNSALRFNTFVSMQLSGQVLKDVYPLERGLVLLDNTVKVLTQDSTLSYKKIKSLYSDINYIYISRGINEKDQVITTGLSHVKAGDELKLDKLSNKITNRSSKD